MEILFVLSGLLAILFQISKSLQFDISANGIAAYPSKTIDCGNSEDCEIRCFGNHACQNGIILCPRNHRCDLTCAGAVACHTMTMYYPTTPGLASTRCLYHGTSSPGEFTCPNMVFPVPDPNINMYLDCTGRYKCVSATIYCPPNADCYLNCGSGVYGCSGITLYPGSYDHNFGRNCAGCVACCGSWNIIDPHDDLFKSIIETQYSGKDITCNANKECTVLCTKSQGCLNARIKCPPFALCTITCEGYEACMGTTIVQSRAFPAVNCVSGTRVCDGLVIITNATYSPTTGPSDMPSSDPTTAPTFDPTNVPTNDPTADPSVNPTSNPTIDPTIDPTLYPTIDPTNYPTNDPSVDPSNNPTNDPTIDPTNNPTNNPTIDPTFDPISDPSTDPTTDPIIARDPTSEPTVEPTTLPTMDPTFNPSYKSLRVDEQYINATAGPTSAIKTTSNTEIAVNNETVFGIVVTYNLWYIVALCAILLFCFLFLLCGCTRWCKGKKRTKKIQRNMNETAGGENIDIRKQANAQHNIVMVNNVSNPSSPRGYSRRKKEEDNGYNNNVNVMMQMGQGKKCEDEMKCELEAAPQLPKDRNTLYRPSNAESEVNDGGLYWTSGTTGFK